MVYIMVANFSLLEANKNGSFIKLSATFSKILLLPMAFCRSKNQNIAATSRERKTYTAFLLNFLKKYVARGITASQVMALSLASNDKRKDIEVQINKLRFPLSRY